VAGDGAGALAVAEHVGYPVIVRRDFGSGGAGTLRCRDAGEVLAATSGVSVQDAWVPEGAPRFVVQRFVDGEIVTRPFVAWHGEEIAGFTRSRLATHPGPFGPGSVVEFVGMPAVAAATRRLAAALGIHGFAGAQFLLDRDSGRPLLMEVNRRMLPATHSGSRIGIDLAAALATAMRGERWSGPCDLPEGCGMRLALFPQEWYRDPGSRWLRQLACDLPWHDPTLLAAMTKAAIPAGDTAR
jgi:biotin carboxylase